MPVYLWTKLKGFAFTSRSQLGIVRFSPNKTLQSDDGTYSALTMQVPAGLRKSCQMYTAWRAEISHKLQKATGKRLHDFPKGLSSHFTQQIESFVAFDDGDSTGSCSGLQQLVSLSAADPNPNPWQLLDPHYVDLFVIRNGFDNDWLSGRFPQVWTLRDVALKVKGIVASIGERERRTASVHRVEAYSLHSHCIDLFRTDYADLRRSSAKSPSFYIPSPDRAVEHRASIMGSLQYVYLPQPSSVGDTVITVNVSIKSSSSGDVTWMVIRCYSSCSDHHELRSQLLALGRRHAHDPSSCTHRHLEHYWRCGAFHFSHALDDDRAVGSEEICLCQLPDSSAPIVMVRRAVCVLEEEPTAVQSYNWHLVAEGSDVRFMFPHQYESISLHAEAGREGPKAAAAEVPTPVDETAHPCWLEIDPFALGLSIGSTTMGWGEDCSSNALDLTTSQFPTTEMSRSGDPVGVRDLLMTDLLMGDRRLQRISECIGVVVSKQLLLLSGQDRKRKMNSAADQDHGQVQCSVSLRDLMHPDCLKVYLPASYCSALPMGAVVLLRDLALTLPETKKKLYLQLVTDWDSRIGDNCDASSYDVRHDTSLIFVSYLL